MKNILLSMYKIKRIRPLIFKLIASTPVKQSKSKVLRDIFKKYHNIDVGYGSYGGCFSSNNLNRNVKIGKYCSIATNIYYFNANHPLDKITTHPMVYNPVFNYVDKERIQRNSLTIGNDVWIGYNTIILSNCTKIGNGVVIGAGSVVTKNVPDYAIIVGSPAKVIGYRFEAREIDDLNKLEWWNMSEDKINEIIRSEISVDNIIRKYKK